jgi:hypothetical protein
VGDWQLWTFILGETSNAVLAPGLSDAVLKVIIMILFFLDLFFAAGFFYRFLYGFLKKRARKLRRR